MKEAAGEAGCQAYIAKPIDEGEFYPDERNNLTKHRQKAVR